MIERSARGLGTGKKFADSRLERRRVGTSAEFSVELCEPVEHERVVGGETGGLGHFGEGGVAVAGEIKCDAQATSQAAVFGLVGYGLSEQGDGFVGIPQLEKNVRRAGEYDRIGSSRGGASASVFAALKFWRLISICASVRRVRCSEGCSARIER